jgi:hypothetical protein
MRKQEKQNPFELLCPADFPSSRESWLPGCTLMHRFSGKARGWTCTHEIHPEQGASTCAVEGPYLRLGGHVAQLFYRCPHTWYAYIIDDVQLLTQNWGARWKLLQTLQNGTPNGRWCRRHGCNEYIHATRNKQVTEFSIGPRRYDGTNVLNSLTPACKSDHTLFITTSTKTT